MKISSCHCHWNWLWKWGDVGGLKGKKGDERHAIERRVHLGSSSCRCSLQLLGSDSLLLFLPLFERKFIRDFPVYPKGPSCGLPVTITNRSC
ncbi:hypothetical protein M5D96_005394 [Drosophila gunungcola]|uniref:Uncharacterized protein n=1 Tax=Drosophila gunungcola TaxID=103775 RepID=A0A9P9YQD4_9MUSC|nr:hypothetical protein M5D96_005394 [Drosophila gunungcola]